MMEFRKVRRRERIKTALCAMVLIAVLAGGAAELIAEKRRNDARILQVIPMANRGITWEGAGYSGIWGRD